MLRGEDLPEGGKRRLFQSLWWGGHCTGRNVCQEWSDGLWLLEKSHEWAPCGWGCSGIARAVSTQELWQDSTPHTYICISVCVYVFYRCPERGSPWPTRGTYTSQSLPRPSRACARGPRGGGGSLFLERESGRGRTTSPSGPRAHPAPAQAEPARPHSAVVAVGGWVGEGSEREEEGGGGELRVHPPPSLPGRTHDSHMPGSFVHLWWVAVLGVSVLRERAAGGGRSWGAESDPALSLSLVPPWVPFFPHRLFSLGLLSWPRPPPPLGRRRSAQPAGGRCQNGHRQLLWIHPQRGCCPVQVGTAATPRDPPWAPLPGQDPGQLPPLAPCCGLCPDPPAGPAGVCSYLPVCLGWEVGLGIAENEEDDDQQQHRVPRPLD